jgi:small subunit ribosomal protein S8
MMTDPIADFLTRLRNAQLARHKTTTAPASKLKMRIAQILKDEGYLDDVRLEDNDEGRPVLHVTLKYDDRAQPVIEGISRVSRPGLRRYSAADDLPKVRGGIGMAIISTSKGVMTDQQARKDRVGGEVLCTVW